MWFARQPGPEIEELVLLYQQTLKEKQQQVAAMNQELEMYLEQTKRFKEEIVASNVQIAKINKQWVKKTHYPHKKVKN